MMTALFHDPIRRAGSMRNLLLASVGAASLLSMPAYAQTAPADEESGEIFVTARKNTESAPGCPVTVTAVTGETLENFGANQVQDVAGRVPTLNVQVGGSGSGGSISLRGVGSSAISASFDSAVAFDFDGVVQSSMRLVQAGFFDVKQIDVLKGPQSLFFGKSASAGVFSLHSADPTKSWKSAARHPMNSRNAAMSSAAICQDHSRIRSAFALPRNTMMFRGTIRSSPVLGQSIPIVA
ncbi:MAG: Plug domain-containing protein [Sphingomonadales bacterium]|nr:Plug domain-containing protein [Sphingomonadales bacterium]